MKKRRTLVKQLTRNLNGFRGLLSIYARQQRAQERANLEELKQEKIRQDLLIAKQREALLSDQVVLKDMQIDLLRHKLETLGVEGYGSDFMNRRTQ